MTKRLIKKQITTAVLKNLPERLQDSQTVEEAMNKWWLNIRNEGGLRLSDLGDSMFRTADIEFFDYDITPGEDSTWGASKNWLNFVLELNNKIPCPYYIHKQNGVAKIRIYDSKVAILISLHGNIFSYIKATKSRK